jgi:hypothetical protein
MHPPEPGAALVESLGVIEDEDHLLVLGNDGPDLMANGRLAVCIDNLPTTQNAVRRTLIVHGFTAIRARRAPGCQVLTAEVPAFGLRRCA